MVRTKKRTVEELYNGTDLILLPEARIVLRGSCYMQGPIHETDYESRKNMEPSQTVRRPGTRSMSQRVGIEAESGTCNVCSAPCSSCMHFHKAHMGSKGNEYSDESCHENASSRYSMNDSDVLSPSKSKGAENLQQAASETSNQVSVSSSHDSVTENAESKAIIRSFNLSEASGDVKVPPKLPSGGTVEEDQLSRNPQCDSDQKASCIEDSKRVEGHDDNTSCVSRANNTSVDDCPNRNADMKTVSRSSVSVDSVDPKRCGNIISSQTSTASLDEHGSEKDVRGDSAVLGGYANNSNQKAPPSLSTDVSSHKLVSSVIPKQEDADTVACSLKVQGLNSHAQSRRSPCNSNNVKEEKLPESSNEHFKSSSTKETGIACGQKSSAYECLVEEGSEVTEKISSKSELEFDKGSGDQVDTTLKCCDQNEHDDNSNELAEIPEVQESPLPCLSGDETGESDIVEQDVKVCDICGDAGREALLAVCSRCSDGAEHTYCMRQMLQKVPEGEWLCEGCKLVEETENRKQGEPDIESGLTVKLDSKVSDVDAKGKSRVSPSPRISGKRAAETIEVASTAKRQAREASIGSSANRAPTLSRDSSFKSLEKGKVRPIHQTSNGNHPSNEFAESARSPSSGSRLQTSKGALLKSNSFSVLSSKPKVKLVDDVPPKQKGAREHVSLDIKDGALRTIGKSMSFKSSNSIRSSGPESKVKMLSPRASQVQDFKSPKHAKDRNTFERKNLSKLEHPVVSSTKTGSAVSTPKGDHKLTSRGESPFSLINNSRDSKIVNSDGKLTSSRSISNLGRKSTETTGVSGGVSSAEQKSNLVSLKEEPSSSSSLTADRPPTSHDGFPQLRESSNLAEKTKESSISCSRQTVTTGLKVGHDAESCTIESPGASGIDVSTTRNSREDMKEGNKLKAAITAAMLKKPGIYKKKVAPEKLEELPISNTDLNGEVGSQDKLSVPSSLRNMISAEGIHDGQAALQNSTPDSHKLLTVDNMKQPTSHPRAAYSSKVGDSDSIFASDGKPTIREVSSYLSAALSVCKMTVVPELECIWQGNFEVHRGGMQPELCGGFQAHVSTCASPKVNEVMNKFPHKLFLSEVPRLSTWPVQFHESGAKEENIALYFFAKDLESYQRTYKGLVESMMKNDLALKGNIDGVELLIFPSNQLPERSKRWNMLYFLWGVFRGKKVKGSDHKSGSLNKLDIPSLNITPEDGNIPATLMSSPENHSSRKRKDEDLSSCDKSLYVVLASDPLAAGTSNGDRDTKLEPVDQKCLRSLAVPQQHHSPLESHLLPRNPTSSSVVCPEIRSTDTSVKEEINLDCKQKVDLQPSVRSIDINSDFNEDEKTPMQCDAFLDKPSAKIFPVGNLEVNDASLDEKKRRDVIISSKDAVKLEVDLMEEAVPMSEEASMKSNPTMKDLDNLQFSRKRPHIDLDALANEDGLIKKLKTGISGVYGYDNTRDETSRSDTSASEIHIYESPCDKKVILEDPGVAERFFFPVAARNVEGLQLGDISWKAPKSEEDQFRDIVPNLDLALGAETKSPSKSILPFLVGVVDKNPDKVIVEEEEDVSASLSLSLSFPIPDKEETLKPAPKTEQLLPERHRVNTSLLLFGGFPEK